MPIRFEDTPSSNENILTVSQAHALFVNSTGDEITSELSMTGNRITNLATPIEDKDAINKKYLTDSISTSKTELEKILTDQVVTNKQNIDSTKTIIDEKLITLENSIKRNNIDQFRLDNMYQAIKTNDLLFENVVPNVLREITILSRIIIVRFLIKYKIEYEDFTEYSVKRDWDIFKNINNYINLRYKGTETLPTVYIKLFYVDNLIDDEVEQLKQSIALLNSKMKDLSPLQEMIKTYTFHLYNPKPGSQIQVMINHANPIIIAKLMYKYEIEYFNDRKTIAEYRDMKTEWRLSENENNKLMIEYRGGELTMPTVRSSVIHVKVYYISKYPD